MSRQLEPDSVLRISITPSGEPNGYVVTTAYQGWRFAEKTDGTRAGLVRQVLESLEHVLSDDPDDVRITLGPDGP
jgi:hypothetical protein